MWLARLTEMGLLRAGFVPPKAIRDLRDYTRARTRLVHERTRCWQRMEKLLEGALLTELPEVVPLLSGRAPAGTGTVPAHDRNGRSSAGSGVAGGVAEWVA
jgi:hypothetical protein